MREEDETLLRKSVDAMARALALYHGIFAREAVGMLGQEKGTALVENVVRQFGLERGRRVREQALAAGDALDLKGMNEHNLLSTFFQYTIISMIF